MASDNASLYLDEVHPDVARVGYGDIGRQGRLGYDDLEVSIGGQRVKHALSTHAPAHLVFSLDGSFASFRCRVALNDSVPSGRSHSDFSVLADGSRVALAAHVVAGEPARSLAADIRGVRRLELKTDTNSWEHCHAVWLEPRLERSPTGLLESSLTDCLDRVEITLPEVLPQARRVVATIVSPGFEHLLDDMLGSLNANGRCEDALIAIFSVGTSREIRQIAEKYGATVIRCRPKARVNATVKSVLYSVARAIDAESFLCLDADMLVLGDLSPIFAAVEACAPDTILACREGNSYGWKDLGHMLRDSYGGSEGDLERLLGEDAGESRYPLVVNDGLFAGGRSALLALDGLIRGLPEAAAWTDERPEIWWRNQFVFNLALARLGCGVELDPIYNLQLTAQEIELGVEDGRPRAHWSGREVKVVHFNGQGRHRHPECRNLFARVPDPLVGGGTDAYTVFLNALRTWAGRHGMAGLTWSFYGTSDGTSARVRDPSTLPLLAALHYLIRANGCRRVVEAGTANGISAACMAAAIAHRPEARVVTFDPEVFPGRKDLWTNLPTAFSDCIEARAIGSLEGMTTALNAGERYDAALLDSIHTAEHVWAEFQLATRLVCTGGLILIHDVALDWATVAQTVDRIQAAGYGVARLWTAEGGIPEDDRLGLAVVENRRLDFEEA